MKEFRNYLKEFPHYEPKFFDEVKSFLTIRKFHPKEYFLKEGEISKEIAFIEKGIMRLFYLNDGKEVTTSFNQEKTITCAYQSLLTKTPSDVYIQAIEPSTLVVFSYESLKELYRKELFWQQIGRLAAEKEYIEKDCHNRFLNDLSATERYLKILNSNNELLQRVPLQYLASYLQVTPETLSRIRSKISGT